MLFSLSCWIRKPMAYLSCWFKIYLWSQWESFCEATNPDTCIPFCFCSVYHSFVF